MSDKNIKELLEERNEALRTLDRNYVKKYYKGSRKDSDHFLLSILHKSRFECIAIDDQLRLESKEWLQKNGFKRIFGLEFPQGNELPE